MSQSLASRDVIKIKSTESSVIGHVWLSYLLLDMVVWVYGWPRHPEYRTISPTSPPATATIPNHLADIVKKSLQPPSALVNPAPGLPIPDSSDVSTYSGVSLADKAVQNFIMAHNCSVHMKKFDTMAVFHALGFVVGCFRPVRLKSVAFFQIDITLTQRPNPKN
jgi:hypothetical protein